MAGAVHSRQSSARIVTAGVLTTLATGRGVAEISGSAVLAKLLTFVSSAHRAAKRRNV